MAKDHFLHWEKSKNTNKSIKILRGDQRRFAVWVGLQKSFWETRRFSGLPLELESVQLSIGIFHIVNFLLRGGAPEVGIAEIVGIGIVLQSLG